MDDFRDAEDSLDHLRDQGLIHSVQIDADVRADTLTDRGWGVLEASRRDREEGGQAFHAGVAWERELQHDSDLFRAYREVDGRLREQGADIDRVVLQVDLRREYQRWLKSTTEDAPTATAGPIAAGRDRGMGAETRPAVLRGQAVRPRRHRVRRKSI